MLKVLFCSPYSTAPNVVKGGINTWGRYILSYSERLSDKEVILKPISFDRFTSISSSKSLVTRLISGIKEYYHPVLDVISEIRSVDRPDVMHICTSAGYGLYRDLLLLRVARKHNVKTIIHLHFGRIPDLLKENNWEWRLLKKVISLCDTVVVMNRPSEDALLQSGFTNVKYLPNPLGQDVLDSISTLNCNLKRFPRRLLYAGHVIRTKGVYELVEACTQIPDVNLRIVGKCFSNVQKELEKIAADRDNGHWLDIVGEVSHDEVILEMMQADMFVFPSYTEGFPNVILEAMACGCPILSSNVGAIPEMLNVNDTSCGICFNPRSVSEIVDGINLLIDNVDLKQELSSKAQNRVNSLYTTPVVWKELVKIWYEEALDTH